MPLSADPRYPRHFADVSGVRMAYVEVGDALDENVFVERVLPGSVLRQLTDEGHG